MLSMINVRFALDSTFEFTLSAEQRKSVHESNMRIVTKMQPISIPVPYIGLSVLDIPR
jgi:hypothetical protein